MSYGNFIYEKYVNFIEENKLSLKNNYLYSLPNDILKNILFIIEKDAAKIIFRNIYKLKEIKNTYYNEFFKLSNLYIINKLYVDGEVDLIQPNLIVINAFSLKTYFILKNLSKFLNGKEEKRWLYLFIYLINSILNTSNILYQVKESNNPFHKIMLKNEDLLCKLLVKFNLFSDYESCKEYYWVFYSLPDNFIDIIDIQRRKKNFDLNNLEF